MFLPLLLWIYGGVLHRGSISFPVLHRHPYRDFQITPIDSSIPERAALPHPKEPPILRLPRSPLSNMRSNSSSSYQYPFPLLRPTLRLPFYPPPDHAWQSPQSLPSPRSARPEIPSLHGVPYASAIDWPSKESCSRC